MKQCAPLGLGKISLPMAADVAAAVATAAVLALKVCRERHAALVACVLERK